MHHKKEVVWTPILGGPNKLHGIALSRDFAALCLKRRLPENERKKMISAIWSLIKPESWKHDYPPSDIFLMYEDTLLPIGIYMQHADSGKWLSVPAYDLKNFLPADWKAVTYSFHHTLPGDYSANLWLQYAFDRWSKYAVYLLE